MSFMRWTRSCNWRWRNRLWPQKPAPPHLPPRPIGVLTSDSRDWACFWPLSDCSHGAGTHSCQFILAASFVRKGWPRCLFVSACSLLLPDEVRVGISHWSVYREGFRSVDPQTVNSPRTGLAIFASKTNNLINDSSKHKNLKQFGWNQDSNPSSLNSVCYDL